MTSDQVVGWLLGFGHYELLDNEARPIGEQAAHCYVSGVVVEDNRSFGDSRDRSKKLFNAAALRQLRQHWPTLIQWVSAMGEAPVNNATLFRRLDLGIRFGPLLSVKQSRINVPSAALYKLCLGYHLVISAMLMKGEIEADAPPLDISQLDTWLDQEDWLIGSTQVCAGTRGQIRTMFGHLRASRPCAPDCPANAPWVRSAANACLELEALLSSVAGAARAYIALGRDVGPQATSLYTDVSVPRLVATLRNDASASLVSPTFLFEADAVPASIRRFIQDVSGGSDLDSAFLRASEEPARKLMEALSIHFEPLTSPRFDLISPGPLPHPKESS